MEKGATTNRGFGFVQMADLEVQQTILKQKIHMIGGRECQVKIPFTKVNYKQKYYPLILFLLECTLFQSICWPYKGGNHHSGIEEFFHGRGAQN